jgi:DNA-binding FadR family transcriptional regulator
MNGTTVDEIHSARIIFEPACVRLFTERCTDDDLDELRACIEQMRGVTEDDLDSSKAPEMWAELTGRFQSTITDRCGNNALRVQAGVLRDIVRTHQRHTLARGAQRKGTWRVFRLNLRSYDKLVDIMATGDGPTAEEHWATHLRAIGKILLGRGAGRAPIVDLFG